jgi:hypothetical protein
VNFMRHLYPGRLREDCERLPMSSQEHFSNLATEGRLEKILMHSTQER